MSIRSISLSTAILVLGGLLGSACDSSGGGTNPPKSAAGPCPESPMIENGEDMDDRILANEGRGGYLYTYLDELGTEIDPPEGAFEMVEGGANGTKYAMRMKGKLAAAGGDMYAGMGFGLMYPEGFQDASKYSGVSFWAKKGAGSAGSVRFKSPDINTDPAGKICGDCYNDFGKDLELTEEWAQYTVLFEDMAQLEGWGSPRPNYIDNKQLFGMQWQVAIPGAAFEIWVDEVAFVGCSAAG